MRRSAQPWQAITFWKCQRVPGLSPLADLANVRHLCLSDLATLGSGRDAAKFAASGREFDAMVARFRAAPARLPGPPA